MNEIVTPDVIANQADLVQIIIWIGCVVVSSMALAIGVLWRAKEARDKYIREQDKANLMLLSEIANNYKILGVDVSKLEAATSKEVLPKLEETRANVLRLISSRKL